MLMIVIRRVFHDALSLICHPHILLLSFTIRLNLDELVNGSIIDNYPLILTSEIKYEMHLLKY